MLKKVSVIIPAYNVERYIAATVRSVLEQTYQEFELLLVDDGSPDRSVEICQQFDDPRIKILRQPNRGVAEARNAGIRQARGEYLAFLDGDDLWLPEKLAKHVEHLNNSPSVGVSFSCSAFIDEASNPLGIYQLPTRLQKITPACVLCRNPIGNGSAPVIRREVLEAIQFSYSFGDRSEHGYFDPQFQGPEDIECWLRIAIQTNWQIEGLPEALTLYRVNSKGLSTNLLKHLEAWERVIDKTRSYAPELVERWENLARAYLLRYLARRAVTLRAGSVAVNLISQALRSDWRILFEEPRRTLLTGGAAYLLWLLPQLFYDPIETWALKTTGVSQRRRLHNSSRKLIGNFSE